MIRFDNSNIIVQTCLLNSLISISTESTISKELAAAAVVIAIISERKNTGLKKKHEELLG